MKAADVAWGLGSGALWWPYETVFFMLFAGALNAICRHELYQLLYQARKEKILTASLSFAESDCVRPTKPFLDCFCFC